MAASLTAHPNPQVDQLIMFGGEFMGITSKPFGLFLVSLV
jgi:hypothetical protein